MGPGLQTGWIGSDLSGDADKRIDDYSKGMRQKVGRLIQALLHDPDVVFLDEPTSGLDPRAARTVLDVIADLTDDATRCSSRRTSSRSSRNSRTSSASSMR